MSVLHTLRGRLTAGAVLATAVVLLVTIVAFNSIVGSILARDLDHRLRTRLAAATTTVVADGTGTVWVRESPEDSAIDEEIWVFADHGAVLRATGSRAMQDAIEAASRREAGFLTDDRLDLRMVVQPIVRDGNRVGSVVSATSLASIGRSGDVALVASLALAALSLVGVAAASWWAIGRALNPVLSMTRAAAEWSDSDPGRRFGATPRPDELGELASTFDDLMDRVAASLRHEQQLSAELSHELRTPLARITAEMELLQRRARTEAERQAAYAVIDRSADQVGRILDTLMAVARAGTQTQRGRSTVEDVLLELDETWRSALTRRAIELRLSGSDAVTTIGAGADVVERILSPLVDNAARFAAAVVSVAVIPTDGGVAVEVSDDGPGPDPALAARMFDPGVRSADDPEHQGAGLGLPLSRRLARAVGGDVESVPGPGGAVFRVSLPA